MPEIHDENSPSSLIRRFKCPGSKMEERKVEKKATETDSTASRGIEMHKWLLDNHKKISADGVISVYDIENDLSDDDKEMLVKTSEAIFNIRKDNLTASGLELSEYHIDLSHIEIPLGGTCDYLIVELLDEFLLFTDQCGNNNQDQNINQIS